MHVMWPSVGEWSARQVLYIYKDADRLSFAGGLGAHDTRRRRPASEALNAAITVSIDFYAVPDEKAMGVAQLCVQQRHQALEKLAPGRVSVLQQSVKPYSGGGALELAYAAQIPGSTYMYLGYVSGHKIFNFTLTSGADKLDAAALFNRIVGGWLRVKLP
jgi:hypothetical protein